MKQRITAIICSSDVNSFLKMLAHRVLVFLLISFSMNGFSQVGEWTWMKGTPENYGSLGEWGIQGVPDVNNHPPSVYEACEWKDKEDNLWIFGGVKNFIPTNYYGTLWKYNVDSNTWVWMKGPGIPDQPGVYGTQGISSPFNYPGARGWGELSWTDSSGNFWLFGGSGYASIGSGGELGDLWKYDVITNEWTWMKGSDMGNYEGSYGVQGVADISNNPPARQETACAWTDSQNNLWMFGGRTTTGYTNNDLWRYEIVTNTWTWMKGSNSPDQYGVYGTIGVSSPLNTPGSRWAYTRWIDEDDNLWLYGGNGYGVSAYGYLEDLWKYNISTNEWTWMGGSGLTSQEANYKIKCVFSPENYPGSRVETRSCWVDECGYFFLYGGSNIYGVYKADLWVYARQLNQWSWISGDTIDDAPAVPGIQGTSSSANKPGLRTGSDSWIDQSGNLWLFGGGGCSDDLWRFVPDYSCIGNSLCFQLPQANFSVSDTQVCEKFCIDFIDQSSNGPSSWFWSFEGGNPASSTAENPADICYDTPGNYDVTLITSNANGNDTLSLIDYITVFVAPPFPVISQSGNTLTSSPATFYQWQLNEIDIPGATNQSYTMTQSGLYAVIIYDENGCENSVEGNFLITGFDEVSSGMDVMIYPNPSNEKCTVVVSLGSSNNISVEVFNLTGHSVFYKAENFHGATSARIEIEMKNYVPGLYLVEVKTGKKVLQQLIAFN